jgi:hypothetical protein
MQLHYAASVNKQADHKLTPVSFSAQNRAFIRKRTVFPGL